MSQGSKACSRRVALSALAGGAALAGAASLPGLAAADARDPSRAPLSPTLAAPAGPLERPDRLAARALCEADRATRAFLGPYAAEGAELEGGFRVRRAFAPREGAVPLLIEGPGGELCSMQIFIRDPEGGGAAPIASGGGCAIYLTNGGDGQSRSQPASEAAARALAAALDERALAGAGPPSLLTHSERARLYPRGISDIPR